VSVSLEQALTSVMRNNPLVRVERIDLDMARTAAKEQAWEFEPSVTAAQLDDARARVACVIALADLYLKDGSLLERRGIGIPR